MFIALKTTFSDFSIVNTALFWLLSVWPVFLYTSIINLIMSLYLSHFIFGSTGIWTQEFMLEATLSLEHFLLHFFSTGGLMILLKLALDYNLPASSFWGSGITDVPYNTQKVFEIGF
jgi:hypothetical protein